MTVVKDFIGGIANKWLEDNIKKSFGKNIEKTNMYIARVLAVEDREPPPPTKNLDGEISAAVGFDAFRGVTGLVGGTYILRCRILSMTNMGGDLRDPKETNNPHAAWPDPCDLSAADAKAAIFRHPTYTPLDEKLKKPYVGDLIRITHDMLWVENFEQHAGHYVGYVVASPAMKIPPPPAGRGGLGGRTRLSKPKPWGDKENPPKRYAGKKLAAIAKQAAYAINNAEKNRVSKKTGDRPGLNSPRQSGLYLDVRLRNWKPVDQTNLSEDVSSYAGIPKTWYDSSNTQFQALEQFILYVCDGYPGMPNTPMRKWLLAANLGEFEQQAAWAKVGPEPAAFAKDYKYWKLWWTGRVSSKAAPLFYDWRTIVEKGVQQLPPVRFGFGSFALGDAGRPGAATDVATNKYFPTVKQRIDKTNIKFAGTAGIGDPVCEMYALMMFIKLNFGSPHQFHSMVVEGEKFANTPHKNLVIAQKACLGGHKMMPPKLGTYTVKYNIMPRGGFAGVCGPEVKSCKCGMYTSYPPQGEG